MVAAIQSRRFPAGPEIASALGLDLSKATITTTQNGVVSILGAHLPASTAEIGLVGASTPRRTLDFVFLNSAIPVGPSIDGLSELVSISNHRNMAMVSRSRSASTGSTVGHKPLLADHAQHGQLESSGAALIEARQPPHKDQYDEWLARGLRMGRRRGRPSRFSSALYQNASYWRLESAPHRRLNRPPTPAIPGERTKREHFLDRLRRSWHS